MRRALVLIGAIAMLVGVMALPAAADDPEVFNDSFSFDAPNPCTGLIHTVTIDLLISIHDHGADGQFFRAQRTGHTSDGYVMTSGRERISYVNGVFDAFFRDRWHNPSNGQGFEAAGRFLEVDGEVVYDDFRLVCTTGPTLYP